jgi:hypothetical protein
MVGFSTGVHGVVGENGWAVFATFTADSGLEQTRRKQHGQADFATFTADRYTEFAKITIREKRVPWCNSRNSAVTWRAKDGYVQIRTKVWRLAHFVLVSER